MTPYKGRLWMNLQCIMCRGAEPTSDHNESEDNAPGCSTSTTEPVSNRKHTDDEDEDGLVTRAKKV